MTPYAPNANPVRPTARAAPLAAALAPLGAPPLETRLTNLEILSLISEKSPNPLLFMMMLLIYMCVCVFVCVLLLVVLIFDFFCLMCLRSKFPHRVGGLNEVFATGSTFSESENGEISIFMSENFTDTEPEPFQGVAILVGQLDYVKGALLPSTGAQRLR